MRHLSFIPVIFFLVSSALAHSQVTCNGDDILKLVNERGQAEVEIAYPGFSAMSKLATRFSVSSCDGKTAVLSLSPLTAADFISSGIPYKIHSAESSKIVYTASSAAEAMQWHSYPTRQQYDTIMRTIANKWPTVCVLDTIGQSALGKPILALKISDNAGNNEDEPEVLFTSSIHGDELGGFIMMMRLAETLASQSNDGGLVQKLTSGLEIWINPLSNPDGTYRYGDTIKYPTRANINGYDLNRNFPDAGVSSPPPLQPETNAMIAFMRKRHFVLSANYHGGSEVVNYPWDKWLSIYHADNDWFDEISRRYADTVHEYCEPGYLDDLDNGVTRGAAWYTVNGGRQDYVTYELGGRELTIELDLTKQTPATDLETLWNDNRRSFLHLLEEALFCVHGIVTDAETGLPLGATIYIAGHDKDSSQVYSDTTTGSFSRFLSPGSWSLTVSCEGYQTQVIENVNVIWNDVTWLDIQLEPASYPEPPDKGLLIYPSPSEGSIKILPPDEITGEVQVSVFSRNGSVVRTEKKTMEAGIPVDLDLTTLAHDMYIISVRKLPDGPSARGKVVICACGQR